MRAPLLASLDVNSGQVTVQPQYNHISPVLEEHPARVALPVAVGDRTREDSSRPVAGGLRQRAAIGIEDRLRAGEGVARAGSIRESGPAKGVVHGDPKRI